MGVDRDYGSWRHDPLIGTSLGRYVLLECVGAGGMGTVFLALDPELERNVALKLLPPATRGSALRERQLREAKAMAMVAHPNVATVYDIGVHDERIFIAMEFIDGWSLKRWLREPRLREPTAWREVLDVFIQAARGLAAAHERGLVHRDFKPGNVMVGRDGRARVVDFGLASWRHRSFDRHSFDRVESERSCETTAGTPAYMAPEQRLGKETDARSDQFSFCLALWEGLYGERPFMASDPAALVEDVLLEHWRPVPSDSEVPEIVHQVIERGLASDPSQRFASMRDLIDALQRSTGDPPASRRAGGELALPSRYRVLRPVPGLGRAHHAADLETGKMVVVMLGERLVGERLDGQPARLDSARQILSLRHPHLAPVSDLGVDGEGLLFFSLEVAGLVVPLLEHLRPLRRRARLAGLRSLLLALSVLHERDILHGAVGPRTALAVDGQVVLAPVAVTPPWSSLAPERLMGQPPSRAADLYAVGALAFELFTGSPPYPGETWEEVTDAVLSRIPAYELVGEPAIEAWLRGLLAERPERRTSSIREALEGLVALTARPTPPLRAAFS
jgi:serine/threonine protein kinase